MSFPKYPEYKDSGVEWLGEAPAEWSVAKLKWFAAVYSGDGVKSETGLYPLFGANGIISNSDKPTHCESSTLIGRVGSAGAVNFAVNEYAVSDNALIIENSSKLLARFCYYWAGLQDFSLYISTTAQPLLTASQVKDHVIAIPNAKEQAEIVTFLDHETARIDALVEEQQRLIELLKEKRQAMISHAISDHGDGLIGKLGYYVDLLPGYAFPSSGFEQDPGVKLLRGVNVGVGRTKWNDVVYWPKDQLAGLDDFWLEAGDIVFGMDRPWISGGARIAIIERKDLPVLVLQRVARLRARRGLHQDYLRMILSSLDFKESVEVDMTGVSVPHISPEQITKFRISLPQYEKQVELAKQADEELATLDNLLDEASNSISLMQERRSALISAAVTGKIDVRGWQADQEFEPPEMLMAAEDRANYKSKEPQ